MILLLADVKQLQQLIVQQVLRSERIVCIPRWNRDACGLIPQLFVPRRATAATRRLSSNHR